MSEAHVELVGLSKRFGSVAAVSEVSLAVPEGQVTTLLGSKRLRQDHACFA